MPLSLAHLIHWIRVLFAMDVDGFRWLPVRWRGDLVLADPQHRLDPLIGFRQRVQQRHARGRLNAGTATDSIELVQAPRVLEHCCYKACVSPIGWKSTLNHGSAL